MVDLVYALHDFAAENGDELSFGVGEAIVVLERDDQYNDGWFQVSTLSLPSSCHRFPPSFPLTLLATPRSPSQKKYKLNF